MNIGVIEMGVFGVAGLLALLLLLVVPVSAFWVWNDSQQRGTDRAVSLAWALATFFVWMPVFVIYLVLRNDARFVGPTAFQRTA